jgi:hypothetical protein
MHSCRMRTISVWDMTRLAHRSPNDRRRSWALANFTFSTGLFASERVHPSRLNRPHRARDAEDRRIGGREHWDGRQSEDYGRDVSERISKPKGSLSEARKFLTFRHPPLKLKAAFASPPIRGPLEPTDMAQRTIQPKSEFPSGLEISFDCRVHDGRKPILSFGAHLILSDGCAVDLGTGDSLTSIQRQSLELAKGDARRKRRLAYLNTKLAASLFDINGTLRVFCPTCETEYTLTIEQYQEAYERFTRGE